MQLQSCYLVCATPRSGSTLLCEALTNTGVAGYPKEYFEALKETGLPRRPIEYFETWDDKEIVDILGEHPLFKDESVQPVKLDVSNYSEYLKRVLEEGTTPNGVFGAKVMWGYFDDFISNLQLIPAYRNVAVQELLASVFPDLRYIYATRRDKVRQAISLWRAIQSWTWKQEDSAHRSDGSFPRAHKLIFHYAAIDYLVQQILTHETSWQRYFKECGVEPLTVVYEEFETAYEETTFNILEYLDIPIPEDHMLEERRMKKQADALSNEWVRQYLDLKRKQI